MKKMKRILCLLLVCCICLGNVALAAGSGFSDVKAGQWFYEPITAAAKAGIVAGNADGSYAPSGILSWAQTLAFATRLDQYNKGLPLYGQADQGDPWYQIYVDYCVKNGIITAAPADPSASISRGDAAIIFAAVLGTAAQVNNVADGYFLDVPASSPAYSAVYKLARAGISNGMGNRAFGLGKTFTRSEVAAIAARMAGLVSPAYLLDSTDQGIFDSLTGKVFRYYSGVTGGTTTITFGSNGSFTGSYSVRKATETGTGYLLGTVYESSFSGTFKVASVTSTGYTLSLRSALSYAVTPGTISIKSGMRHVATEAYGFEGSSSFEFYKAATPTNTMPECLLNSMAITQGWGKIVPAQCAYAVMHNSSSHKAFVEDIPAGVTAANLFARLEGKTLTYASGNGTWSTTITFGKNGNFTGIYSDTRMDETGVGYAASIHVAEFKGNFTEVVKQGDCKYSLRLGLLNLNSNPGAEWIEDGIRYVTASAVGFEKAGYFTLYLPGMDMNACPESMKTQLGSQLAWGGVVPTQLPCWSLYNIGGGNAFITFE